MNRHMPLPPVFVPASAPFRRRVSASAPARQMLGLRGTAFGPAGQTLPVWAMWMADTTAELALEDAVDGALVGQGWTLDLPGLGQFAVALANRRGSTCRVELSALTVDNAALSVASARH